MPGTRDRGTTSTRGDGPTAIRGDGTARRGGDGPPAALDSGARAGPGPGCALSRTVPGGALTPSEAAPSVERADGPLPTGVLRASPEDVAPVLMLGARRYDVRARALVMGIVNRTPDSFYDRGATFALDALVRRAEQLVAQGADLIDVGGVKAGPGPEVSEAEELDRVIPAVVALAERVDVPISIDTWRSSVAAEAFRAGAVLGNDISGFADPAYLSVAAAAGASVVATHIRLAPRVADPDPHYTDVVGEVRDFLVDRAGRAQAAGLRPEQVVVDAGLDLGKTAEQSLALLRASRVLASTGYPLLLSASNKTFLGVVLDLPLEGRIEASWAAGALGIVGGCRILRVHDVTGARMVRDLLAELVGP